MEKSSGALRHQSELVAPPPFTSSKHTGRCLLGRFVSLIPPFCCCICRRFSPSPVLKRAHIRKFSSQLDTVNQIGNLLQPWNDSTVAPKAPGAETTHQVVSVSALPPRNRREVEKKSLEGATYHVATSAAQGGPIQPRTCRNKLI